MSATVIASAANFSQSEIQLVSAPRIPVSNPSIISSPCVNSARYILPTVLQYPTCYVVSICSMYPEVSILLPYRNASATLPECIESILAQTFEDYEIIAIDDASDDNSTAVLLGFRRQPAAHYP